MATVAKLSSGVRPADIPISQLTTRLAATLTVGDIVRLDATNGTFVAADAAAAYLPIYVLVTGGVAGEYATGISKGKISGFDLSGQNFGVTLYAGASGTLDTAAGTGSNVVGRVIPATANATVPFDKILEVG